MNGTGLASNFLHEAWATFVEALMLRSLYGADAVRSFWDAMRNSYMVGPDRAGFAGGFEGQQSIRKVSSPNFERDVTRYLERRFLKVSRR